MKKGTEYNLYLQDAGFDQAKFKDIDPGKLIRLAPFFFLLKQTKDSTMFFSDLIFTGVKARKIIFMFPAHLSRQSACETKLNSRFQANSR